MSADISTAMILAAGFGTRMRDLTRDRPKALVTLAGRPLIDWVIERCQAAGIRRFLVNAHYKADLLADYFAANGGPPVTVIREDPLLDTGGGVRNALARLGDGPFLVANCDSLWLDGLRPAAARLADAWDDACMDALLMLHPTVFANDYDGRGDFFLDDDAIPRRRAELEVAPYLFAGFQILHPRLFDGAPDGAFSLNRLYDRAAEAGRLRGLVHDGEWYHTGTPEQLDFAARIIASGHTSTNTR